MINNSTSIPPYVRCRKFLMADLSTGMNVLDVGCGDGDLMKELAQKGCTVSGVDIDPSLVEQCQGRGLRVSLGTAETLPVADASFDAIVCSVVLPYTDERLAVYEWARVLKTGGVVNVTCHGLGYGLNYFLQGPGFLNRIYGFRMMVNTLVYRLVGRRLPGPLGDTLCQSSNRMKAYYRAAGLALKREEVIETTAGFPRFFGHQVLKN